MQLQTGFQSELSWKIFLDRYTMKDPQRRFQVGDLVIALVEPHPKWPKKDVGVVKSLVDDDFLSIELITGPQKGELIERRYSECDRPLETTIHDVARRIAKGVAAVERPPVQKDVEDSFAQEIASLRFVPGGRIWAGAGTGQELTYFNCVAKETLIHTQTGLRRIDELSGPVSILTQGGQYRTAVFNSYGVQALYRVLLDNGDVIYATAGHEWIVVRESLDTETVTTLDLMGKRIPIQPPPKPEMDDRGVAHGMAFGCTVEGRHTFTKEQQRLWERIGASQFGLHQLAQTDASADIPDEFRGLPPEDADPSYWRGFIAGLLAIHGTVDAQGAVLLSQLPRTALESVRAHASSAGFVADQIQVLQRASNFGAVESALPSVKFYASTVQPGDLLLPQHRQRFIRRAIAPDTVRVVSVEATDRVEEVFCCNEPETHTMVVGQGYLTRQCYVIPSPQDSRQGIVTTLGQMIEIMSRGGGVGINISSLRPQRAIVRGVNGRSSGAVSWMDLFSRATGLVEQGGSRRGALMLQIEDWHPDVWRFINVKKTPGMVENANISVRISDRLMEAIKSDGDWELVFPDTTDPEYDALWDGNLETWRQHGKPVIHYETVKARQLWNAIVEGAWQAAEPGIVFDERHEKDSNSWYFNPLISTNPCVAGDTLIATDEGLFRAQDLYHAHRPLTVLLDERFGAGRTGQSSPVFMTGIKPLVRIVTREGYSVRVTPDHRIYSDARGWVSARDLQVGEAIRVRHQVGGFGTTGSLEEGRQWGRRLKDHCSDDHRTAGWISPVGADRASEVVVIGTDGALQPASWSRISPSIDDRPWAHEVTGVPPAVLTGSQDMQRGFLQALLSAPRFENHPSLTSSSVGLLQDVQQLLLNFGIYSRVDPADADGTSHVLRVSTASLAQYRTHIEMSADRFDMHDGMVREQWVAHVTAVTEAGIEPVYDLTEFQTHAFSANGLVVHNCAEQPLPAWGVCTLGHINLAAFYNSDAHDVDWDGLRATIRTGTRFLDDIVDATPYFFKENFENQQRERRIGLGTMGLGELLIRLHLRYGSPESIAFIDKLYAFIATEAYLYDVELAKEKGAFPAFVPEKYLASGFMERMPERVRSAIRENGTRNVTILTQAPTGTVGSMVNTSTGIEPFYALTYYRQSRLGFDEQYVRVAQEWMDAHPGEKLPDYFVGAMDLTPEEHVRVQAAIQRWTDSSISKTANAPSSYTIEDTAKLYELAYDLGCKGVTIYRDQSRQEQVLHLSDSAKPNADNQPESGLLSTGVDVEVYPLPAQVNGRTYRKETPAGTARVVINEVDGSPFEVFMLLGRAGSEVQSFMEALGRIISLYLRSNGNLTARRRLELVADQLKGIGGANQMGFGAGRVLSVVDGIGKLLESHLNQGQGEALVAEPQSIRATTIPHRGPSATYDLCPQCDAPSLIYEEGCQHCTACGYSKC
jgi:ribonucleoside-diphosphate reductase alpha chain